MLLHDLLRDTARRLPEKTALVCGGARTSWGELARMASCLATTLRRGGLRPGDRVAIFARNGVEVVAGVFGALEAGGVFVPISPQVKARKLAFLLADAEPAAFLGDASLEPVWGPLVRERSSIGTVVSIGGERVPGAVPFAEAVEPGPPLPPAPARIDQDLAALLYTSGSTGDAKGVMLTHLNMLSAAASVGGYLGYREDDVVFDALPLSFDYGLYQVLLAARVGATVVLETSFTYPAKALDRMESERVTVLPGVPTLFAMVLAQGDLGRRDLSRIRILTSTGAVLPERHIRELREAFPGARLFSMYGLTECKRVSYLPPEELDRRPTSVGRGMDNEEVYLAGEDGRRLPPGETGELVVRGSHVMRGYWRRPRETAERLRPGDLPGEMHLWSGDLFRTDAEGFLYYVGRKDDLIKSRGEKVSPREVEDVLSDAPGVLEAAVRGEPDPLLGEAVVAWIVPRPGPAPTERDVLRHCAAHLEPHMVPKRVRFVSSLPRTLTGKVSKKDLAGAEENTT